MSIKNPNQLVNEFKKSGEFDRLRRELLTQFQQSEGMGPFMARVEDVAQKRLESDSKLHYMSPEVVHRELLQELDRYPIIERALAELQTFSDPAFATGIQQSVQKILKQDRSEETNKEGENNTEQRSKDERASSSANGTQTPKNIATSESSVTQPIESQTSGTTPATLEPSFNIPEINGAVELMPVSPEQPPEEMDTTD